MTTTPEIQKMLENLVSVQSLIDEGLAKATAGLSYFSAIGNFVSTGERVIMTDKMSGTISEIQKAQVKQEMLIQELKTMLKM